ncbi:hypothetical protein [Halomonas llamarensis]|uniref:Uncharacterized protein n=1 Tax=Halomonas llamarensis TaxID=2945104 RepID=A0ABT0SUS6_9GAMM|nr:hypothetical protein [Halomonas llamarensis]MCL7931578.1 hypothetical protein [Halomonas llamarensis]
MGVFFYAHGLLDERKTANERVEREKAVQEGRQETLQEAEERVIENKRNAARKLIARTEMNDQLIAEIEELPKKETH